MAYDVTMVEFQTPGVGMISLAGLGGFPSTAFDYLLTSMWLCLPYDGVHGTNFVMHWPFMQAQPRSSTNTLEITLYNGATTFFDATYNTPFGSLRSHVLISVNCVSQVVQVYINDVPVAPASGGFSSASRLLAGVGPILELGAAGGTAGGHSSAIADVWSSHTPAFVDLSITANRRKFVNRDLSPVYLGAIGTEPTGTQPPVYLTVPSGGMPGDFRNNYGMGGAFTGTFSDLTLLFEAPGVCTLPPPPPVQLAMDNVVVTATATLLEQNLISLRWSDDRGHSWGSPVTQDIGEIGEYWTSLQWQRCGFARDRVWELSWSVPMATALQGCWLDAEPADGQPPAAQSQGGS